MTLFENQFTANAPLPQAQGVSVHVFWGGDFQVTAGANLGDALDLPQDVCEGDIYVLDPRARVARIDLIRDTTGAYTVAKGSEIGAEGTPVQFNGRMTFLAQEGDRIDVAVLTLGPPDAEDGGIFALPLDPIEAKKPLTLLVADTDTGEIRLTDIAPVAFTRGTMITMADGAQCPVEQLRIGDLLLTRDNGAKPVRWIGRRTVRAIGSFAPVVINKGTFANSADMIVSQFQRLFIYQPEVSPLIPQPELLVRARDLVDDETVFIRSGGYVDYFFVALDRHEILYAECVPAESLLVDNQTIARLQDDLAAEVAEHFPDLGQRPHYGLEADRALIRSLGPDAFRRKPGR